jgi:diguanylate cyclase (GGDEF)-like protein
LSAPDDEEERPAFEPERTVVVDGARLRQPERGDGGKRYLVVRSDRSHLGEVVSLTQPSYVLGRNPDCEICVDGDGVSRRHARLVRDEEGWEVEDLGSANGTYVQGRQVDRHRLQDGEILALGPMVSFRFTVTDAEHERTLRQLYEASVRDALTGAFNREYLGDRMKGEIAFANRHRSDLALLMLDIDHFKKVNDTYGHPAGDAVLIEVASLIRMRLRLEDVFARFGGEEFVVLLRGATLDHARRAGERIREMIEARAIVFEDREIRVTVSVGCASLSGLPEKSPDGLVAAADRRLYKAKGGGRNRVVAED